MVLLSSNSERGYEARLLILCVMSVIRYLLATLISCTRRVDPYVDIGVEIQN